MKLREQILKEQSRDNCNKIVQWIGNDPSRFNELFQLYLDDDFVIAQRASWPLSNAVMAHPELVPPYFGKLVRNLKKPGIHNAVIRNTLRLLQDIAVPKKYHGELMNTCFNYISDPKEKVGIKAFSLTILENLSKLYPDIKQELKTIIQDRWEHETAAFRSRGRKILKEEKRNSQ